MRVSIGQEIDLPRNEVFRVFRAQLYQLTKGYFIRDDKVYRTVDMQGHGSDFDEVVGPVDAPSLQLQVTAIRLQELTADLCMGQLAVGATHVFRELRREEKRRRCVHCPVKEGMIHG